jgi:hypothetical protein
MPDGSDRPAELLDELTAIVEGARANRNHTEFVAQRFDAVLDDIASIRADLERLQEVIYLEASSPDDDEMDAARRLWESVEPGRQTSELDALVSKSPTLHTLRRASVTITSVYRYDEAQLELAKLIGKHCGAHPQYVGLLARTTTHDGKPNKHFFIARDAVDGVDQLVRALEERGLISGYRIEGQINGRSGPYWREKPKIGNREVSAWRVKKGAPPDGEAAAFLGGHWLTAYTYSIASDQFEREGKPFEIYANVQYSLPDDQGGGASDIDVLVRTADVLLCIECKTGKVLQSFNGKASAAAKAAANAARFDELLVGMQVDLTRVYQLVYMTPPGEPKSDVQKAISNGRVSLQVMTPPEVRGMIQRIALEENVDGGSARA